MTSMYPQNSSHVYVEPTDAQKGFGCAIVGGVMAGLFVIVSAVCSPPKDEL